MVQGDKQWKKWNEMNEKIMHVTCVTRCGVPEAKCTRCYGAISVQLLKNPELILTWSTIYGWEQDQCTMTLQVGHLIMAN